MKKINKICLASVATLILGSAILSSRAIAEDAIFTVRANAVIELTVPSIVNLNLYPTTGSDFNTASMDISVGTNNPTGYTLTMTADSDTLTRTGSITDGSNNTYTPTILPMLTTGSATGYTAAQFESSTTDAYTLNRWGYKLSTATNFMPMTTTTTELSTTNAPSNGDTVTLDFAAKVDTTKPAGTYQTTLNFNAVTNYVPLTCNPTGTTINTIVCMQDLNTSNYDSILASMTVNQQYQLFDNRDEKQYYVAKLADGNIWMTQNLDHDIVTTANFYTPQNTDIPANWTASTATYATSNTAWNNSYTTPESYDPGDLCWDGTLGDKTLTTGTTACGNDRHMHIGNYYNWTAAVAMNNSSSFTTGQQDVDQSICPAGWRLPTYSGDKSYTNLVTTLSLTAGTSGNIQSSPVYFVYGGYWSGSSIYVGSLGFYWSSVARDSSDAMGFLFNRDNYMNSNAHVDRSSSNPVRCVARSPKTIQSLTYMQDFAALTNSEKIDVFSSMSTNHQYQLKDNRDEKTYYISKLGDGNVWMTQNLDHDIVTTANFYTPQNTDISATWTAQTTTYATNDATWSGSFEDPESYDPGDLCWNGTIRSDDNGTITTDAVACGNDKHYHIGNYYNWTAAVAMNDSSSYTTDLTDVGQSICPAGWRLPTYSGNKSYDNLVTALSLTSGTSGNVQSAPAYFVYGGSWRGESGYVGGGGSYWSSVVNDHRGAYEFSFTRDDYMDPQGFGGRGSGNLVRCVARRPTIDNISDLTYMQEFKVLDSSEKANVLSSMTQNQQYQLKDNRDEKTYYIAKLVDGNVWMTQNLDHDIISSEEFYTPANTDIPSLWESWFPTRSTGDTTWSNTNIAQSYDPGDVCWDGVIMINDGPVGTITCGNDRHYHLGNYYSLAAALAMETTPSLQNDDYEIDQSICPAGWRLPAGGSENGSGSFSYLVNQSNITTGSDMINAPLYYVYGGSWQGGYLGSVGLYYSSMHKKNSGVYGLWISDPTYDPAISYLISDNKGVSVRCVAR